MEQNEARAALIRRLAVGRAGGKKKKAISRSVVSEFTAVKLLVAVSHPNLDLSAKGLTDIRAKRHFNT